MAAPKKKTGDDNMEPIDVAAITKKTATFYLVGTTPIWFNSMSMKARQTILYPKPRMTSAEKAQTVKHNPYEEFRASTYEAHEADKDAPTQLVLPSAAFKQAICTAALDTPSTNVTRAKLGRLVYVEGQNAPIWGIPELGMAVVRSADQNKTPDIRTRCVIRNWATVIRVTYVTPMLSQTGITTLLAAAGVICGVGDWRQQKGSGNFGLFEITDPNDSLFQRIVEHGGREAQIAALENPTNFDVETERLYTWWQEEHERRGKNEHVPTPARGRKKKDDAAPVAEAAE